MPSCNPNTSETLTASRTAYHADTPPPTVNVEEHDEPDSDHIDDGVRVFPRLVKLVGPRDGIVLSRAAYWVASDRGRRPRGIVATDIIASRHGWLGTLEAFAAECGLSYGAIREAIRALEADDQIERYRLPNGRMMITLPPHVVAAAEKEQPVVYVRHRVMPMLTQLLPVANYGDCLVYADLQYWQIESRRFDDDGFFLKTHDQLREETGLSPSQIERSLHRLEAGSLIARKRQPSDRSRRPLLHIYVPDPTPKNKELRCLAPCPAKNS